MWREGGVRQGDEVEKERESKRGQRNEEKNN